MSIPEMRVKRVFYGRNDKFVKGKKLTFMKIPALQSKF